MDGTALDRWRLQRRRSKVDWGRVTSTRSGTRVLDLRTTSIRVRRQGDAMRGVVFICDPPNLIEHYDDVFAEFGSDSSVACIEQPGFGFSFPKRDYDFSVAAHADALAATLRELNFGSCTLVAPCVSAFGAMRAAREHPRLIDHLVLMQATDWHTERAWVLRTAEKFVRLATGIPRIGHYLTRTPYLAQLMAAATERSFGGRTYPSVIFDAKNRGPLLESLIRESDAAFAEGACNCMPALLQSYFRGGEEAFSGCEQPTRILWGDSDPSHASSARDGLCAYVHDARVERIEGTGHHLELENPAAVCACIQSFVAECEGTGASPA